MHMEVDKVADMMIDIEVDNPGWISYSRLNITIPAEYQDKDNDKYI